MELSTLDRTKRRRDADIKKVIDEHFRPLFGANVHTGIPVKDVISYINESNINTNMPTVKLQQLIHMYDLNNDGLISYKEFTKLMLAEHERFDLQNLSIFQRLVLEVTATTVPHSKQKDYLEHYTCKPPPLFMILISLCEIGVFIYYYVILTNKGCVVDSINGISIWSPLIWNPNRRYEAWRFVTYALMHVGYVHLIVNLVFQCFLGIPLEMVHGWWRILLIYVCGAITGSMAHSVADNQAYLAGASGGAYAIAIAHVANVIMNWEEMQVDWLELKPARFLLSAPVRLVFIFLLAGVDTGVAIYNKFDGTNTNNVGIAAHIGGMVTGLLLGIPVLKNIDKKPWETILFYVALIVYIIIVMFAIMWNIFFPIGKGTLQFRETDFTPIYNSSQIPPGCV